MLFLVFLKRVVSLCGFWVKETSYFKMCLFCSLRNKKVLRELFKKMKDVQRKFLVKGLLCLLRFTLDFLIPNIEFKVF